MSMEGKIIRTKGLSASIVSSLREDIEQTKRELNTELNPRLGYIVVGDNLNSANYIKMKTKMCAALGIEVSHNVLPGSSSETEVLRTLELLNNDRSVHGILVQLPLPLHLSTVRILDQISPTKDLDCLSTANLGKLASRATDPHFFPCTPLGCLEVLKYLSIDLAGKHIVVVGRSNIVGTPLSLLLSKQNATVTLCHSFTENLSEFTRAADILCVAIGKPKYIGKDMVKEGSIVLDAGVSYIGDSHAPVGDVDIENVLKSVRFITPVPGGLGPMTITMLMSNIVKSWKLSLVN